VCAALHLIMLYVRYKLHAAVATLKNNGFTGFDILILCFQACHYTTSHVLLLRFSGMAAAATRQVVPRLARWSAHVRRCAYGRHRCPQDTKILQLLKALFVA
jgi:hypothetical protein